MGDGEEVSKERRRRKGGRRAKSRGREGKRVDRKRGRRLSRRALALLFCLVHCYVFVGTLLSARTCAVAW